MLIFTQGYNVSTKLELVQSFCCNVAESSPDIGSGWLCKADDCKEILWVWQIWIDWAFALLANVHMCGKSLAHNAAQYHRIMCNSSFSSENTLPPFLLRTYLLRLFAPRGAEAIDKNSPAHATLGCFPASSRSDRFLFFFVLFFLVFLPLCLSAMCSWAVPSFSSAVDSRSQPA